MCGVFGFVGKLEKRQWALAHRLLIELAVASEERGIDAAGYAVLTTNNELLWQRRPGPARNLFLDKEFAALRRRNIMMAVGHTRLATNGVPAVNGNNHPHLAGDWALVHNGYIPMHEHKAAVLGLPLRSQCDSEILAQALAQYGDTKGPEVCLAIGGKQSVLAINAHSREMLAWTNGGMPLVAFRIECLPGIWWASTEVIARKALKRVLLRATFAVAEPGAVYRNQGQGKMVREGIACPIF
jgi:glucosamine 6-phosphate synthetase-like amidotransferase/phosphosugar isomerase protein